MGFKQWLTEELKSDELREPRSDGVLVRAGPLFGPKSADNDGNESRETNRAGATELIRYVT